MNYFFAPHARQELMDATLYLSEVDPSLGRDFAEEVERAIALILQFPEAWPRVMPSARRCRMQIFPYAILYRIWDQQIEILAVMHSSRKPDYWTERLKE